MPRQKILIMGARIFAEELADLVSEIDEFELTGFVENFERDRCKLQIDGLPVYWIDEIENFSGTHKTLCSLATTKRVHFVDRMKNMNFSFATVIHPLARISSRSEIGAGSMVSVGAIIAAKTTIGEHVRVNRGVIIGHHDKIGNYVSIQPGANIGGCTEIGDFTYIGMGATILPELKIGSRSIVGAGAVVTKDVPDNVQVVGVPARIVKENIDGL